MTRWLVVMAGLAGCAEQTTPVDAGDGAALERAPTAEYYQVEADLRMCPSPMCGGYWIVSVNHASTRCADGTVADRCYVASLGTDGLFATRDQEAAFQAELAKGDALVHGTQVPGVVVNFAVTTLDVDEAWLRMTGATPSGRFVRLNDTGMLCLAYPCANVDEEPLNRRRPTTMIAEVDFTPSGATPDQIAKAVEAMGSDDGLIVAGRRFRVTGPAGSEPGRTATEMWTILAAR